MIDSIQMMAGPEEINPKLEDCQGSLHPMAERGLELFNTRQYWKAHEALEEAWRAETGQIRHLYRAILQVGVAYFHAQNGNYKGVMKLYRRSQRWLNPYPENCRGIHVQELRLDFEAFMAEVRRLGPERLSELDPSLFKPVIWNDSSSRANW
ncbi:MAG: DUF309 domain-containing protein [Omnitrophica WOR_2 bacterium]